MWAAEPTKPAGVAEKVGSSDAKQISQILLEFVCVCVCVEGEKDREEEGERDRFTHKLYQKNLAGTAQ